MRCRLLPAITALILLALGVPAPAAAREILLLADQWCPYNCDPRSDHPGYAVEIVREAFQPSLRIVYRTMNWTRSVAEARAGHADAVIGIVLKEAPEFVFPNEPIGISALGLAVRSDSDFRYSGPHSLDGQVLGLAASYVFGGQAGAYIRQHEADRNRVQIVSGDDALTLNLRKLQAGRIDIVVDDANVLAQSLSRAGPSMHVKLAAATDGAPVYIAFSPAVPDAQALCATLDGAIRRMRATGQLARILARYDVADWK